jgi:hypothetical protein
MGGRDGFNERSRQHADERVSAVLAGVLEAGESLDSFVFGWTGTWYGWMVGLATGRFPDRRRYWCLACTRRRAFLLPCNAGKPLGNVEVFALLRSVTVSPFVVRPALGWQMTVAFGDRPPVALRGLPGSRYYARQVATSLGWMPEV